MSKEIDQTIAHLRAQVVIHDINNQPKIAMQFRDQLMAVVEHKRRQEEQEKANKAYWATWPEAEIVTETLSKQQAASEASPTNNQPNQPNHDKP